MGTMLLGFRREYDYVFVTRFQYFGITLQTRVKPLIALKSLAKPSQTRDKPESKPMYPEETRGLTEA